MNKINYILHLYLLIIISNLSVLLINYHKILNCYKIYLIEIKVSNLLN